MRPFFSDLRSSLEQSMFCVDVRLRLNRCKWKSRTSRLRCSSTDWEKPKRGLPSSRVWMKSSIARRRSSLRNTKKSKIETPPSQTNQPAPQFQWFRTCQATPVTKTPSSRYLFQRGQFILLTSPLTKAFILREVCSQQHPVLLWVLLSFHPSKHLKSEASWNRRQDVRKQEQESFGSEHSGELRNKCLRGPNEGKGAVTHQALRLEGPALVEDIISFE